MEAMVSGDFSSGNADKSGPSLWFPLASTLLLIIIFSLSGIFSYCYYSDRLRFLRQSNFSTNSDPEAYIQPSPSKSKPGYTDWRKNKRQILPVLMPGDQMPKFMALQCPCAPPRPGMMHCESRKAAETVATHANA